ncbi:receptor-type tyrosine-protein phosphatase epsilon-like isoform X2 [Anneissia japonica]|uniref:receptor-type tyrosine-protein phosphatase epsilon-like isoform X2 n=1 Tax=Anneissia japonica TaxID=1529436 RepID=UPI00142568D5|nr:receptor-type tyrosine-protein phosphatase epsilon-like isoform X2 [Anneissia japonica]
MTYFSTLYCIEDNVSPNVTCPADIDVSTGRQTTWNDPVVTDNIDTNLLVNCDPPSGSSFDVGENNVTCSATDSAKNEGSCMFVVEVNKGNTDTISDGGEESSNITLIVVIVLVVTLILIIIAIVLVWKIRVKRRDIKSPEAITYSANKGISGKGLEQQIHEPLTPEITHTQDNTELPYINQDIRKAAIPIHDLPEYVRVKKASGELDEEWELLPEGVESSERASVAFDSQNASKNRYRNVVPYDEHRVVLEKIHDDPYSDYINACFIKGFTNEKAYIAAQGPNKTTIADFWRMIWQENVYSIVMVTNLVEDGKNKCTKYWPDDAKRYGDILVSTVEFVPTTSFTIRKLKMLKGKDVQFVKQYHFLVWPDKNIPRASSPVISMLKVIRKEEPQNAGPVLVHCSAGAGRTGAVIAIDAMMDMAQQTQEVNIFEFVKEMRKRRPNMVQTPLQYKFVYDTILEFVIFGETSIPVSEFKEHYKKLRHVNPKSNKTYLSEEFEALQRISSTLEADSTKGGLRSENRKKNRYPDILPYDRNRPFIMTPGENGPSDYINASFFDSFDKKDMFLGTQAPMRNTVEDFWRMIADYNSKAIVTLNDFYNRDKTVAQFWPENSSQFTFRHLTVNMVTSENLSKQIIVHTVDIMKTEENSGSLNVKIFEYLGWPAEKYTPTSSKEFLQLVTVVNKQQSEFGDPPVVVMCMDGVGRTGVFCATLSSLRKVNEEQIVDIVQGVKLLRNNRPGMVETLSQYEFIYKTVLEHLLAFEVYDNLPQENGEEAVYANV